MHAVFEESGAHDADADDDVEAEERSEENVTNAKVGGSFGFRV